VPADRPLIIFDFDGTLVHGDSFGSFCVRFSARNVQRALLCMALLPLALPFFILPRTRRFGITLLVWGMTVGLPARRLARALSAYVESTLDQRVYEAILSELTRLRAGGATVVIVTGSLPILVRHLLEGRGVHGVQVLGSRLQRRWGGLTTQIHCIGRTKVSEIERWTGATAWSAVYTDSAMDLPLMQRAQAITLVAPSARTLRRVHQALPATSSVRVWPRGDLGLRR
jgi:phosphatidylglycerophosphatase C